MPSTKRAHRASRGCVRDSRRSTLARRRIGYAAFEDRRLQAERLRERAARKRAVAELEEPRVDHAAVRRVRVDERPLQHACDAFVAHAAALEQFFQRAGRNRHDRIAVATCTGMCRLPNACAISTACAIDAGYAISTSSADFDRNATAILAGSPPARRRRECARPRSCTRDRRCSTANAASARVIALLGDRQPFDGAGADRIVAQSCRARPRCGGTSEQRVALRERQDRGRFARHQHAVGAHLVRLRIDLDVRQRVVVHHVALADARGIRHRQERAPRPSRSTIPHSSPRRETNVNAPAAARAPNAPHIGSMRTGCGVGIEAVRIAHRGLRDRAALDHQLRPNAEERRLPERPDRRSCPTSTEPTSCAMPCVIAGLIVYFAT